MSFREVAGSNFLSFLIYYVRNVGNFIGNMNLILKEEFPHKTGISRIIALFVMKFLLLRTVSVDNFVNKSLFNWLT